MSSKRIVLALCFIVLLVSAFTVGRDASDKHTRHQLSPQSTSPQQEHTVPDHIVYGFLFHKIASLNKRTRELQAQGRIGRTPYFPLQDEANLTQAQARVLSEIASACLQEVQKQDERAGVIIEEFRAQFPGGRIPAGATPPPPPPPELKVMWEERNAILLQNGQQRFAPNTPIFP